MDEACVIHAKTRLQSSNARNKQQRAAATATDRTDRGGRQYTPISHAQRGTYSTVLYNILVRYYRFHVRSNMYNPAQYAEYVQYCR
jgi:hypothetical protein